MDVVVQFAIHRLGFQPQDIVIYAWSIGGFTGTCHTDSCPAQEAWAQALVAPKGGGGFQRRG